jgi:putative endonuclease
MVRCSDGTLYTGITIDLEKRIEAHNSGKDGARYTRSRRPVKLVYSEQVESKSAAAKLECQIKRLPRDKKKRLIKGRVRGVEGSRGQGKKKKKLRAQGVRLKAEGKG